MSCYQSFLLFNSFDSEQITYETKKNFNYAYLNMSITDTPWCFLYSSCVLFCVISFFIIARYVSRLMKEKLLLFITELSFVDSLGICPNTKL